MNFEENNIYHVYNQGNYGQDIFYNRNNYLYFITKMERYILPYADFLCYCLMPNHFHWLIQIKTIQITVSQGLRKRDRTLNQSIGILLRTYARAVNNQLGREGSLFRQATKAKTGFIENIITSKSLNQKELLTFDGDYIMQCFEYIHQNPVKAKLSNAPEEWEFSSAGQYKDLKQKSICNRELGLNIFQ